MKLCELTGRGMLQWREGEDGASRLGAEGYVVEISSSPTAIHILNGEGRVIETVTEADLKGDGEPGADLAADVRRMAEQAHRVARGAERAIAAILSSLSAPPRRETHADLAPAPSPVPAHADNDDGTEEVTTPVLPDPANDIRIESRSAPGVHAPPPRPTLSPPEPGGARRGPRAMFGSIPSFARVIVALEPAPEPFAPIVGEPGQPTATRAPSSAADPYKPW